MSTKYVIITGDIAKECTISFFNNKRMSLTLNMAVLKRFKKYCELSQYI